jgi:hypothetical protein
MYTIAGVRVCFKMDFLVLYYIACCGKLPKFVLEVNVVAGVISGEEEAFPRLDEAGIIWFLIPFRPPRFFASCLLPLGVC